MSNLNTLATWCQEPIHWKRPWCWERLTARGEGGDRGWDGWMASPTQWTWVWANSRRWWRTGKPGVLQSMGSRRTGHDLLTEQQQNIALNLIWPFGDQNILRIKPPYVSANKTSLLLSAPSTHVESGQLGAGQDMSAAVERSAVQAKTSEQILFSLHCFS